MSALGAYAEPGVQLLFVNDGSTDGTLNLLRELEHRDPDRFLVLDQQPNQGKAEAVRRGVKAALERGPAFVGYWDADLAAPLDELPRFLRAMEERPEVEIVLGARVQLMGHSIERSPVRHYLGRIFATAASHTLGLPVYDTQCGAKLFRASSALHSLFEEPFCTNWVFDVEIIARLLRARRDVPGFDPSRALYELPLQRWQHAPGSKVGPLDFPKSFLELARIRHRYFRS